MLKILLLLIFTLNPTLSVGKSKTFDYLQNAIDKQSKILKNNFIKLGFNESLNQLNHSTEPWEQTNYQATGNIWYGYDKYAKQDVMTSGSRKYNSKSVHTNKELLWLDHGDKELYPVTKTIEAEKVLKTIRYTPFRILNYFKKNNVAEIHNNNKVYATYQYKLNKNIINLYIRKSDSLLEKLTVMSDDELFGDITSTFYYNDYKKINKLYYPTSISIEKINGKILDKINITTVEIIKDIPTILERPKDYKILDDVIETPEIVINKYSSNIHFIELHHTSDRVMLVEFKDFLLVAEAPLNSKNGELIIQEAKKIAPNKPIKYFVFGHYHPHYLGGIRPFIQLGAKIISTKMDEEFIKYIVNAPHTLTPDSLHNNPKAIQIESIKDKLLITDGEFEMQIHFIGEKSKHTKDYLIYYFPSEKLLFQDDLVSIGNDGKVRKARERQAGLYHAIKDLGLDVETVIQSWPISNSRLKTIIPFSEIEASIKLTGR